MKLHEIRLIDDGKYLKKYELIYLNKEQKEKHYEIVSRHRIGSLEDLGNQVSGISIVGIADGKLLLLKEFRMGVGREIYNLCAGMLDEGESIEDCARRELLEESGLELEGILKILPPSYGAVAISDVMTQIVFAKIKGEIAKENGSANEKITPGLYTVEEVTALLETEAFSSRAQMAAYMFSLGIFEDL